MILKSQTTAFAPPPNPPAQHPGMTWAELARKEGHKRGFPGSNRTHQINGAGKGAGTAALVLSAIVRGARTKTEVAEFTGLSRACVADHVLKMRRGGLVKSVPGGYREEMKITPTKRGIEEAGKL